MMKNYDVRDCPFCGENTVSVIHFPKSVTVKHSRSRTASLQGSKGFHVNPDIYIIESRCLKCGKTSDEVEKKFKSK
jgi:rRNA maturation protein Nop10